MWGKGGVWGIFGGREILVVKMIVFKIWEGGDLLSTA